MPSPGRMERGAANWSGQGAAAFCYSTRKKKPGFGMPSGERGSNKSGGDSIFRAQPCFRNSNRRRCMNFIRQFLAEAGEILGRLDVESIENVTALLAATRANGGRLFILGVGGSAAIASHAVNDFRKLAGMEAYAPTDNVSELTARTNDEGWNTVFEAWLRTSRLRPEDMLLVLSVGGGDAVRQVSANLVFALQYARQVGAKISGIVGRSEGYTAEVADACVIVPVVNPAHV